MRPSVWFIRLALLGLFLPILPILLAETLWPLVLVGWGALALAAGLDIAMLSTRGLAIQASPPQQAYVGEPQSLEVAIQWPIRWRLRASWHIEALEPLRYDEPEAVTLDGREAQIRLTFQAMRRGEGQIVALWGRFRGALGCFERIQRFPLDLSPIPILPSLPQVRRLALKHFGLFQIREGIRLERLPGDGSEFDALQMYSPGHDPRNIDWKASARHQHLMVRRFRVERNQRLVFSFDCGHLMADDLQGLQRLDHAIHASLLLSHFALRAGDLVGLHSYAEAPLSWLPPKSGFANFHRMHLACAAMKPRYIETNHVRGLHHLLSQLNRRTLVILFSEFTGTTTAELMIETIGHIVRKHLVVIVALDDPIFFQPIDQKPESPLAMAKTLVAAEIHEERQRVLYRLQKMGVQIVQGSSDESAARLVQRYLEIKRRELLG